MIQLKECPICDNKDVWQYLDELRNREHWVEKEFLFEDNVNFKICTNCGFLTYDYQTEKELCRRYNMMKPASGAGNIIAQNRKSEMHRQFLDGCVSPLDGMSVLDLGSAEGGFLSFFKNEYSSGSIDMKCFGVEFNKSSRAFGRVVYGQDSSDKIPDGECFDFISMYKTLEHMQYPDLVLKKLINNHSHIDTVFYISIPIWGEILFESEGIELTNFENYYHLNHVNVFTRQSFYNLLNKVGLEITKEDSTRYGLTVLCKKSNLKVVKSIIEEDYEEIIQRLKDEKKALDFFVKGDVKAAIGIMPSYVDAYVRLAMQQDNAKDVNKQIDILMDGLTHTNNDKKILAVMARLFFQWDENTPRMNFYSNNIKKSETIFKYLAENIGGNEDYYFFLGMIEGIYKNDINEMAYWLRKCVEINPMKWGEIYNNIGSIVKDA